MRRAGCIVVLRIRIQIRRIRMFLGLLGPDPDPSITIHQAEILRKTLISTALRLLFDFLSLKNDVLVPSKSNMQKNFLTKISFLLASWRSQDPSPHPDPEPLVRGMDPRIQIRIHTKMSWIRNTAALVRLVAVDAELLSNQCCGSGIRCLFRPLDPGSGMGKESRSGSGMNLPDHISESLETIFWVKNTSILCGSGSGIRNLFDPGSGIRDPGWKIRIRDKHPWPRTTGSN